MTQQVRVGDLLNIDNFDPMNVDVGYIRQTLALIPKDGTINLHEAERLATVFLRCADFCDDVLAQAIRYLGRRDAGKKAEKASAIERKVANKVAGTTARETYGNDPIYITAADAHTDAQAFLTWITQKRDNLIKAHVLCKDLMKSYSGTRQQSGWEGADEDFSDFSSNKNGKESISSKEGPDLDFEIDI